ncbi:hypothetical protein ACFE04_030321 [Oxalis oulophora]
MTKNQVRGEGQAPEATTQTELTKQDQAPEVAIPKIAIRDHHLKATKAGIAQRDQMLVDTQAELVSTKSIVSSLRKAAHEKIQKLRFISDKDNPSCSIHPVYELKRLSSCRDSRGFEEIHLVYELERLTS